VKCSIHVVAEGSVSAPGGKLQVIVCGARSRRKRCRWCGAPHTKLCDFKLSGKKAGQTCDAPMCDRCATRMGEVAGDTVDYCPPHARLAKEER
jgi:hypothetical protein